MKKLVGTSMVFVLSLLFTQQPLPAQATTGSILGVVEDESGGVLPGTTITAIHLETNETRTAITGDTGGYRVAQLPLGRYEIQAELPGFNTGVRRPITLTVGRQAVVDFTLTVGSVSEKVVVTGEAPLVETTNAVTAGLVDDKKIRDLPLNGRDVVQLALLQEGVVTSTKILRSQAGNSGVPLSLAGTRIHQTAFLLDGTDIRGNRGTVPAGVGGAVAGVDTIKEFKVITGAFSAEYGRFTGGVITAVTKSGSNAVHGSLFEFHRNSALDARNFFDRDPLNPTERSSVPEFKRNQFGGSVGGPIIPDQTFFFASYEGLRERLQNTIIWRVPNQAARDGQLIGFVPGIGPRPIPVSPDAQPFLDLFPLANGPDLGGGIAEFISPQNFGVDQDLLTVRIDHKFSESDSIFGRYTLDDSRKEIFETPQSNLDFDSRFQYLTLSEKHVFSPSLINDFRFGYTRSKANQSGLETVPVDPSLRFSRQEDPLLGRLFISGLDSFGSFLGLFQILSTFNFSDDLSWSKGSHFFKMGMSFTRFHMNTSSRVRANGVYIFTSLANFLQARPFIFDGFKNNLAPFGVRQSLFGFYLQDDWKFSPRLTLNLGLRYEFITNPSEVGTGESIGLPEVDGRLANLDNVLDPELRLGNGLFPDNPSLRNFSPRIGFAWDVFGNAKTSIRGGFGVFYDQLTSYLWSSAAVFNPPFNVRVSQRAPNPFTPPFPPFGPGKDPFEGAAVVPALWSLGDPKQPYIMQYSLNIQQEIMPNTVFQIGYQGSLGRKLPRLTNDANLVVPVKFDASQFPNGPGPEFNGRTFFPFEGLPPAIARKRNPNFGGIRMELWDGNSSYNALKVGLNRRFSEGLQFQFAYTFSRAIDESSNVNHSDNNGGRNEAAGWSVPDPDDKSTSRGLSGNHIEQTFIANFSYDVPYNPPGLAGHILGGWQVNGILTAADGAPFSLNVNFDRAEAGQFEIAQRPELKPGSSNNPVLDDRDPNAFFDVNAFELAPRGFLGNVGRNTLIGPGLLTFDFGLTKNFAVRDEITIQFKTEFFNVFNRANFGSPGTNIFVAAGGAVQRDPTAGTITNSTTTSRQIQFALKVLF